MAHDHEVSVNDGNGQKTLASYVVGFTLCVVLTVIAFWLVDKQVLPKTSLYIALAGLAIVQLLVQSACFLRLNTSAEGRWNLLPFLFSILIIAILAGGTIWIMYSLNFFGMPS